MTTRSSRPSFLGRWGIRIMLLATPLLLASTVYADSISVGFQEFGFNNSSIHTVGTGGASVSLANVAYGTFTVNTVSAQSRGVLGAPGLLNSNILDISSSRPGVLQIYITAQGLSFTGAQFFASSFAVNALSGSILGGEESTWFSPTNGKYDVGQTLLKPFGFGPDDIGTAGPFITTGVTSGTFSVTEKYVIFYFPISAGSDNLAIDLSASPVPEPGSLLLVGSGLALAGVLYYRRRTKCSRLLMSNA